jgi:hypothetical protein
LFFSDGTAINTRIIAGASVYATSIICPSSIYRLVYLFSAGVIIIYTTTAILGEVLVHGHEMKLVVL